MKKWPPALYFLLFLLFFVSANALAAGWAMISHPDGSALQIPEERLSRTPFSNYFLPGIILFLFNGVLPALTIYGLWQRPAWRWVNVFNLYHDRHWSWTYALFCGVILIVWTTVQMFMIDFFWLQPAFVFVGLLIIIFSLLPRVQEFYVIHCQQSQGPMTPIT